MDIAVKWRFLAHLRDGGDLDSERVYRWHIEERTNGHEPRSWKRTVDDYVDACGKLLTQMYVAGFNTAYPLEYGANGRLRGGAHRLACCLLLGLDAHTITVPRDGTATWGEDWFCEHGCASGDLDRIKADYDHLKQHD